MKCVNTKKFILLLKFAFKMVSFFLVFFLFFVIGYHTGVTVKYIKQVDTGI